MRPGVREYRDEDGHWVKETTDEGGNVTRENWDESVDVIVRPQAVAIKVGQPRPGREEDR